MIAAQKEHVSVVATLLANKAEVNAANKVSYWYAMYDVRRVHGMLWTMYIESSCRIDMFDENDDCHA
jgi:hypothetical protein